MKQCNDCKEIKSFDNFYNDSKKNLGKISYGAYCKKCMVDRNRENRKADPELHRMYRVNARAKYLAWFRDLKRKPCLDCKKIYDPEFMDFDHLPSFKKVASVTALFNQLNTNEVILAEIAKCELVCLLCHNKRTHERLMAKTGGIFNYTQKILNNKKIISEFKDKPCVKCGIKYEHYNMQCDHINPADKFYAISSCKNRNLKLLKEELAKCQVMCAMCHRQKSLTEQKAGVYNCPKAQVPKMYVTFYDPVAGLKECGICKNIKSIDCFTPGKVRKNNPNARPHSYCKDCFNIYDKQHRRNKKLKDLHS